MPNKATIPLLAAFLACFASAIGSAELSLWPEPPPEQYHVALRPPAEEAAVSDPFDEHIAPRVPSSAAEAASVERALVLEQAAERIGPIPTLAEQGGADIIYCPDYRPDLYPGRNLAQQCGDTLLSSPMLAQGEEGRNPFRVAWDEVRRMDASDSALVRKSLIAAAHYWLHQGSPGAIDAAAASLLAEESTGVKSIALDVAGPRLLDLLPRELSGLPPFEELGPGYDIRLASAASYNSVADIETLLHTAAERGLNGIALTDLDHLDALRDARRTAERLKREGVLPPDFLVIPGEEVHTLSGPLIALFIEQRVQRGMTLTAAIDDIHRQGGVAVLADPGTGSGTKLVRTLDVDGYLLRSHPASMFRTLGLLGDSATASKPLLSGSGARAAGTVGIPYSVAETEGRSAEDIRRAFREHTTYGATTVQMPLMTAMLFRPLAQFETAMASWFRGRDRLEMAAERLIGSDNVEIRTSYDKEIANLVGIVEAPRVIDGLIDGTSPLTRTPRMVRVSADYGHVRVGYSWEDHMVTLQGAVQW